MDEKTRYYKNQIRLLERENKELKNILEHYKAIVQFYSNMPIEVKLTPPELKMDLTESDKKEIIKKINND